jgi:hypothetical protein
MPAERPPLSYDSWSETCDTLHAHTQVLGSAFRHACEGCDWDPALAATAESVPPPIR